MQEIRQRGLLSHLFALSTFDSLRIRDYRLLWLGQVGSSMGQWMDQVSRGWLMEEPGSRGRSWPSLA